MDKGKYRLLDEVSTLLEKGSARKSDPEEVLSWYVSELPERFSFVDAAIYVVDKDKKNGYVIVSAQDAAARNVPFTVRARPEILNFLEPGTSTVLKPLEQFGRGVFRLEEFVKIVTPADNSETSFLSIELNKPTDEKINETLKIGGLFAKILSDQIERTEIYKLLYGGKRSKDTEGKEETKRKAQRDETLSELAGSVAHLLNQPLTSLMGYAELLIRQGKLKDQESTYLNKIYNEAERMADVIRKIESVNSYATEEYLGSTRILKLDDLAVAEPKAKGSKTQAKTKRISKKLSVFLDFYKAISQSKNRGEIVHHYAFSVNKMFPQLKLLLLNYKKEADQFLLDYKEKGGYSEDFELSEKKIDFYKQIFEEMTLKIYKYEESNPHVITIPLVIHGEKLGISEFDFENEEISLFDIILLESMTEELVLALHHLKLSEKNRYLKDYVSNLIENTSSLIFVLDEKHSVRTCNPAFIDSMGMPKSKLEGKNLIDFIPDKSEQESTTTAITDCFTGQVIRKLDVVFKNGKEESLDTRLSLIPLPKVKNLRPEIIAIGQNITEVKQLENQVMQSEKLAYMGQMAAMVAHELNNPLTSITVFTEYLQKRLQGDFPDKYAEYSDKLERIYESTNRIHSFTRNLTSLAKPPEDAEPEKLSINAIIRESILFADYEINKDVVEVVVDLDEEIPEIVGYKSQLHQVFINILGNASHALGDSGGKITLSTADHDKETVKIEIKDDGEGIDAESKERIFEPFFSTKRGDAGTGLGLTIVKRIIDNHKGKIAVASDPGKGTTFSIYLRKFM